MCESFQTLKILRENFMRHLSESSDINKLSKEFGALNSNFERVDYVLPLLEQFDNKSYFCEDKKCDRISIKLREEGNLCFKSKKLYQAWEFYTKSICHAENNSENLSVGYANRSAVLYEMNLHKLCLEDIARALDGQYPETLKSKLLRRRENAENRENCDISKASYYVAQPVITRKSSTIQCASDKIEIKESNAFGRFIVAAKDIKCGDILAIEKPFAFLVADQLFSQCHNCIELCFNLIPCENCSYALYCGRACKQQAYEAYHKYECPIIHSLKCLGFDKLKLLPLKIAILTRSQYDQIEGITNAQCEHYRSDRYNEVHNLITNTAKRSVSDLFTRATAAAIIFKLVKNCTNFFTDFDEKWFKELLLLHMQTGPSNFHEIMELAQNEEMAFEAQEIGSGAYAFLSLLNHSCSPNVIRFCHGSAIVLRAMKDIRKGEQCFDNYGYHFAVSKKDERQRCLKDQYYFECSCEACVNDWKLYENLDSIDKEPISDEIIEKLRKGDVEVAKSNLPFLLDSMEFWQKFIPSKNFFQLQETIKQCYALFGNKRPVW